MNIKTQKSSVLSIFVEYFSLLAPNRIVRLSIPCTTSIANTFSANIDSENSAASFDGRIERYSYLKVNYCLKRLFITIEY